MALMKDTAMNNTFGTWIKQRRKALDLTQEELATRIGCSVSAMCKIEAGTRRPSRQVSELLAVQLEIPPDLRLQFIKMARQNAAGLALDDDLMRALPPQSESIASASQPARNPADVRDDSPVESLPVFTTSFIGRKTEIDFAAGLLQDPACRFLTITGLGGVGKTRLAVEVAHRLQGRFADGVCFLSMAPVKLPEAMIPVLADTLGIAFSGPADPQLQLINTLRHKELLLVFDNMEHLLDGSSLFDAILRHAPQVKLLLTSREQVHLQGEWVFELQGLPVPEDTSLAAVEANSAAALFLQRSRQVSRWISLTPEDAQAVVRICKYVDGLPLAIELAASWARVMPFPEIAQELERNLDLLETRLHDLPARHRSIKAVFRHSWSLLSPEESQTLMKLAVFPGGFTRPAAATVAGASLHLLSSLVSKSLLRYNAQASRYDFHELIRQYTYAELQAQSEVEAHILVQHSQYYAAWLTSLEAGLKSARQAETSALLQVETANWMLAWRWSVHHQRYDLLRQMAPCLYWYYEIHGYYAQALASYQLAIGELRAAGAPEQLAAPAEVETFTFLLNQFGWFQFRTGDLEQAVALFAESLELGAGCHDEVILYHNYINWGYLALVIGDTSQAKDFTLESLAHARKLASPWHIAISETILGTIQAQQGDLVQAYQQLLQSLEVWRQVGDPRGLNFCMVYLSQTALALGEIEKAETLLDESNAIAQAKGDHWAQAFGLDLLGQAAMARSQYENALGLFRESLALSHEIGDKWASTQALIRMGEAQAALGTGPAAVSLFLEAYRNAVQAMWAPTILEALVALASIEQALPVETRLAITITVLAQNGLPSALRPRVEDLHQHFVSVLEPRQLQTAQSLAQDKTPETWGQSIFRSLAPTVG